MINAIFTTIGSAVTAFAGTMTNAASSMVSVFYDSEGLTTLGTLLLISAGVGLVYWAFRLIRGLIRQ